MTDTDSNAVFMQDDSASPLVAEISRVESLLLSTPFGPHWGQVYAASQALHWALDHSSCKSPVDMLIDGPIIASEGEVQ